MVSQLLDSENLLSVSTPSSFMHKQTVTQQQQQQKQPKHEMPDKCASKEDLYLHFIRTPSSLSTECFMSRMQSSKYY